MQERIHFSLSEEPISNAAIGEEPTAGAVLTFEGRIRNHHLGREVSALEYQAYTELANEVGKQILLEECARFGLIQARAIHRVGLLNIGDLAVVVSTAAAHRSAAFEGTRAIMERLKYELPIWKKESYRDGTAEWVGPDALPAASGVLPTPHAAQEGIPSWQAEIHELWTSPGNSFRGRHGQDPLLHPMIAAEHLICIAGKGIIGDRYYEYKPNFKGQITFFDDATRQNLMLHLDLPELCSSRFRRNVILSGINLSDWIGKRFYLQGILFEASEECAPCYWMDHAIAPGAESFLKGQCRGGLRARILSDGVLRTSPPSNSKKDA